MFLIRFCLFLCITFQSDFIKSPIIKWLWRFWIVKKSRVWMLLVKSGEKSRIWNYLGIRISSSCTKLFPHLQIFLWSWNMCLVENYLITSSNMEKYVKIYIVYASQDLFSRLFRNESCGRNKEAFSVWLVLGLVFHEKLQCYY